VLRPGLGPVRVQYSGAVRYSLLPNLDFDEVFKFGEAVWLSVLVTSRHSALVSLPPFSYIYTITIPAHEWPVGSSLNHPIRVRVEVFIEVGNSEGAM
jgi:hypothetical protein